MFASAVDVKVFADLLSAAAWPLVVLVALLILARALADDDRRRRLVPWLHSVRKVTAFGVQIELDPVVSRQNESSFESALAAYQELVDEEILRVMRKERFEDYWQGVVRSLAKGLEIPDATRFTIYVPDVLFEGALYQLVDYYPKGGGRGRRLSIRFGAVGRAWRLADNYMWQGVPTEPQKLVREWGMTSKEAAATGNGRTSFACVIVRDRWPTRQPVALIYMDSREQDAFGLEKDWPALSRKLQQIVDRSGLANLIEADLLKSVRENAPSLSLSAKPELKTMLP